METSGKTPAEGFERVPRRISRKIRGRTYRRISELSSGRTPGGLPRKNLGDISWKRLWKNFLMHISMILEFWKKHIWKYLLKEKFPKKFGKNSRKKLVLEFFNEFPGELLKCFSENVLEEFLKELLKIK